ncbi:MAG: DNA polymerase III subunit gamma/tau [Anaerolineae bacterium]
MGQALYRKWRPQSFDDVVGQEHIVKTLRYALRTGHIHHAYLLAGPRGIGKTTTARLIAKAVNCQAPAEERPCNRCEICTAINEGRLMDLVEIDAASNTGVDNIRDLLEKVGFRPTQATYKVYVIDEVHMLSTPAFNALLKTLEEPPEHVIFVLATTEVHKIPETILSRCQRFEFRRISVDAIVDRLETIAEAEGVEAEPAALELIARAATGSMRDGISLFDQMSAGGSITADYVRLMLGAERREVVRSLLAAWVDEDLSEGLKIINQAVDGGADPRQLARQTADFLRGLLLMRLGAGHTWTDPTEEERSTFAEMAQRADPDCLVEAVRHFSEAASKQRTGWQPQLPLELAFVEAALRPGATRQPLSVVQAGGTQATASAASATEPKPTAGTSREAEGRSAKQEARSPSFAVNQTRERPEEASPGPSKDEAAEAPTTATTSDAQPDATRDQDAEGRLEPGLVEAIKGKWSDIIQQIKPVMLGALLRDADVGGTDSEGRLVLAFKHTFHCGKVAETGNLSKVEEILERAAGRPITVRCLLEEDWQAAQRGGVQATPGVKATLGTKGTSDAQRTGSASASKARDISLEEDELIRRAQEELGAVAKVND